MRDCRLANPVPALLRGLVRPAVRRAAAAVPAPGEASFAERLAQLPQPEQFRVVLDRVRAQAAAVLGHRGVERVGADKAFRDLGFDSLTSVELRNRLADATGVRLPATLVFDHPTPNELTARLLEQLRPAAPATDSADPLDRLTAELDALLATEIAEADKAGLVARLQRVTARLTGKDGANGQVAVQLEAASAEDVFDYIDRELGVS